MLGLSTSLLLASTWAVATYFWYTRDARRWPRTTYSVHFLAPSFVSGIHAAYKLGVDETSFLLSLQKEYGAAVYIPFPIKQHFILSDRLVRKIYDGSYNKQLSFIPIRKQMSHTIFGMNPALTSEDNYQLDKGIFPVHSRSMAEPKLAKAVNRFHESVKQTIESERARISATETIDIVEWTYTLMFKASMAALFGSELDIPLHTFMEGFKNFDNSFPLLASGQIPQYVQYAFPSIVSKGVCSRDWLNERFGKWARETQCKGLEEGDVVRDMALSGIKLGFSDYDNGSGILGDFWALLANNPFAISWIIIYLLQAEKDVLQDVLAEIDSVDLTTQDPAQADLPLLTSVIFETLRLQSSSYSIRKANHSNVEPTRIVDKETLVAAGSTTPPGLFVLPGEKVVCITRVGHLDSDVWGTTSRLWDGRRFHDVRNDALTDVPSLSKSRRIPEVRAFGGGVSICEGRNLALAELKTFLVPVLQALRFTITPATLAKSRETTMLDTVQTVTGVEVFLPKIMPGRPGLGVMQPDGPIFATIEVR